MLLPPSGTTWIEVKRAVVTQVWSLNEAAAATASSLQGFELFGLPEGVEIRSTAALFDAAERNVRVAVCDLSDALSLPNRALLRHHPEAAARGGGGGGGGGSGGLPATASKSTAARLEPPRGLRVREAGNSDGRLRSW